MRVIILGSGYLGAAVARLLRDGGHSVAALTRNADSAGTLRTFGVSPVICADLAESSWHAELNPADASVVNCVSPASPSLEGYRHSFLTGAQSILAWLEKSAVAGSAPARDLLFTSATSVYPQTDGGWVGEDDVGAAAALSAAGAILRETENLLQKIPSAFVQRIWIMRLAGIYGPDRHQLLDNLHAGRAPRPENATHWLNLIHREDAASAICMALAATPDTPGGVFNVVDDEPVNKGDLVRWLAQKLGMASDDLEHHAVPSMRSAHRRGPGGESPNRRVSNRRLKSHLSWHPAYPTFREGYQKILLDRNGLPGR